MRNEKEFKEELRTLINRYSMENGSDTPDFILANYLIDCLKRFNKTVSRRSRWYNNGEPLKIVKLDS